MKRANFVKIIFLMVLLASCRTDVRSANTELSGNALTLAFDRCFKPAVKSSAELDHFAGNVIAATPRVAGIAAPLLKQNGFRGALLGALKKHNGVERTQLEKVVSDIVSDAKGSCAGASCQKVTGLTPDQVPSFLDNTKVLVASDPELKKSANKNLRSLFLGSLSHNEPIEKILVAIEKSTARTDLKALSTAEALAKLSRENLNYYKEILGDLSAEERELQKISLTLPPYIVHVAPIDRLDGISKAQALLSPAEAKKSSHSITPSKYSNQYEEQLFSSTSYAFATVGPPKGRAKYGGAVFHLKDNPQEFEKIGLEGWSTFITGYHFGEKMGFPAVDDRLRARFAKLIVVPKDQNEWLSLMLIDDLRKSQSKIEHIKNLQNIAAVKDPIQRRIQWRQYVENNRLGYMEAKFNGKIPLSAITSIEVKPLDMLKINKANFSPEFRKLLVVQQD